MSTDHDQEPPAGAPTTPTGDPSSSAVEQVRRRVDRVLAVLERVLPVARGIRFAVTALAVGAAGAVALFVSAMALVRTPDDALGWLLLLVVAGVFLIPPVLLAGARFLVSGIIELPERLRSEPGLRRDQLQELAALAAGRTAGAAEVPEGRLRRTWSAAKVVTGARGDLLAYTALLRLASLSYLASSLVAAGFAVLEIVVLVPVALILLAIG